MVQMMFANQVKQCTKRVDDDDDDNDDDDDDCSPETQSAK